MVGMVVLIFGSDQVSSRGCLKALREKYRNHQVGSFIGDDLDWGSLSLFLRTPSFFSLGVLAVVEFDRAPRSIPEKAASLLEGLPDSAVVIFWSGSDLAKSSPLMKLVGALGGEVRGFKDREAGDIFKFLDAVFFRNEKESLRRLGELISRGAAPIYLVTMIGSWLKNVAACRFGSSYVKKKSPFVFGKLSSQAVGFEESELVLALRQVVAADLALKTTDQDPQLILTLLVKSLVG